MLPCISQVVTLNSLFEEDIPAFARAGWRAVEIWLTKLEEYLASREPSEARALLDGEGVLPVAASFQGGLLLSQGAERRAHWDHFHRRLELLQAIGTPVLVVAPDFAAEPSGDDLARAAESLARAGEAARRHGVRLALEFQRSARFCASLDSALAMVGHAGEGAGVCFDAFHYYTGPSKFEDLGLLTAGAVAHLQLSDLSGTPRELATDADRILPGDGDFLLGPILDQLSRIGYDGPASIEMMNPLIWSMPADRVAGFALGALERTLGDLAVHRDPAAEGD